LNGRRGSNLLRAPPYLASDYFLWWEWDFATGMASGCLAAVSAILRVADDPLEAHDRQSER
jgi:hypothetical protein